MNNYTTRGLRRKGENKNGIPRWEACFTWTNPVTGEKKRLSRSFYARNEKAAGKEQQRVLDNLNAQGAAVARETKIRDYAKEFIECKRASGKASVGKHM